MDPATDWVAGTIGGALDFDGIDDFVDLGTLGSQVTGTGTIALWFKCATGDCSAGGASVDQLASDDASDRNGFMIQSAGPCTSSLRRIPVV
jgi:hypothetical protein